MRRHPHSETSVSVLARPDCSAAVHLQSICQDEACMMNVSAVRSLGRAVSRRVFHALCQHLKEVLWLCSARSWWRSLGCCT